MNRPALLLAALFLLVAGCTLPPVASSTRTAAQAPTASADPAPATTATPEASKCVARDGLPDPACTPGVADPRVTQGNLAATICKSGYSTSVRPSTSVTRPIKEAQMAAYGYADAPANYELDHLISLELGGHPSDVKNLWPEAYGRGEWDAARKDQIENKLHDLVCAGSVLLAEAQRMEATDWRAAWTKYVGATKTGALPATDHGR